MRRRQSRGSGFPGVWDAMENRRASRISVSRQLPPGEVSASSELREWSVRTMLALDDVFCGPIRMLVPEPPAEAAEEAVSADEVGRPLGNSRLSCTLRSY